MSLITLAPILTLIVYFLAIHPLQIRWYGKIIAFLAVFCVSMKYYILHLFGGPVFFAPDLPRSVLLSSAWIYAALILWFGFLLVTGILRGILALGLWIKRKKLPENWKLWGNRINLGFLIFSLLAAALGLFWGTCLPPVKEQQIVLRDLPAQANGMKIALLADLHIDYITRGSHIEEIVKRTNALQPDLIVIVGDFVDGTMERCGENVKRLSGLKAKYGVYGVPGNHEYYSGFHQWTDFLNQNGVKMLLNQSVKLPNGIYLSGTTDPAAKRFSEELPDPVKAAGEMKSSDCGILLAHNPQIALKAKDIFDLQLSGHTHGGMILGVDLLVKHMNKGFVSGHYHVGNMQMYLSNGTCLWSGFPIRLGRMPEITSITLIRP